MSPSDARRGVLRFAESPLEESFGPHDPVIQLQNVSKRFGTTVVLDGVSLDVFSGERLLSS